MQPGERPIADGTRSAIIELVLVRLALSLFALQAGFHGFLASLPLALARSGVPDAEIGLIVGLAALVQVPAAFAGGALVDRFGGPRLLVVGGTAYLGGAAMFLLPGVDPVTDRLPLIVARISQGIGLAIALPAALSLVPRLVPAHRRGFGLAFIGSAHNVALIAFPPLTLAILGEGKSLDRVALVVAAIVALGLVLAATLRTGPAGDASAERGGVALAKRRLGFAFRREWLPPLATTLLYLAHWGVVTAYLPQRAELAGANVGLFFAADGVAVLALRIPFGWLADRVQPRRLVLSGLLITAVAIGLLALPPSTPILVLAGLLTGAGAGIILTPLLLDLSRRSTDADRGSAFAMFSASLAAGLVLGSIGASPIIASAGFEATILATIGGLGLAAAVAVTDRGLSSVGSSPPGPTLATPT